MKTLILILIFLFVINRQTAQCQSQIRLNGQWEIAKTNSFENRPLNFTSKVAVPGLVDLAVPAIDLNKNYENGVYWHKTKFVLSDKYPEVVKLKIGKAKYHAQIYLNKKYVGEQFYCFTSATYDIKHFLNSPGEENELLIGVGTSNNMPDTIMWGQDFEKLTYIPGIYDNVELILAEFPYIEKIQTVPDINEKKVRIVATVDYGGENEKLSGKYQIKELVSGKVVAEGKIPSADFSVYIPDCHLWTPESPFLYELKLSEGANDKTVRFGMRSFSFDAVTRRALLNGKPYFMRGTNVCIFRFFEDPERGRLPWDEKWIIKLHKQFKFMHWNSIRYCIGLPPERWYEIADSLGFLIQNEYPVWTGGKFEEFYPGVTPKRLANEYRSWLPEHWNHPSVVIWDAQNESTTNITGEAINMVRGMDLSNRPWENGWSPPQSETDPMEAHPYLFSIYRYEEPTKKGPLADLLSSFQVPGKTASNYMPPKDKKRYPNAVIINEYAWLWLNRNGSTTTITDKVYDVAFGENLTKDERIYLYARNLGMLTEYWRAYRYCAGVLHFCGLGYSRPEEPRGQTSDHFIDIKNLIYEPQFVKYVRPSFAPVGLMIDFWEVKTKPGDERDITVYAINDLYEGWKGKLTFKIVNENEQIVSEEREYLNSGLRTTTVEFSCQISFQKREL